MKINVNDIEVIYLILLEELNGFMEVFNELEDHEIDDLEKLAHDAQINLTSENYYFMTRRLHLPMCLEWIIRGKRNFEAELQADYEEEASIS